MLATWALLSEVQLLCTSAAHAAMNPSLTAGDRLHLWTKPGWTSPLSIDVCSLWRMAWLRSCHRFSHRWS